MANARMVVVQAAGRRVYRAVVGGLIALGGCMLQPTSGSQLPDTARPVTFSGGTLFASQEIALQARDWAGRFLTFHTTRSDPDPPWVAMDGTRIYLWGATAAVPGWAWRPIGTSCRQEAFVQAAGRLGGLMPFVNFDEPAQRCTRAAVDSGERLGVAALRCGSAEPVRLQAGEVVVHTGDVVVRTQAEADALACVEKIVGQLTVEPEQPEITLPASLVEVTGDVLMSLRHFPVDRPWHPQASISALARVGGSLTLRYQAMPRHYGTFGSSATFELPALTQLGGNLTVDMQHFNGIPKGVSGLREMNGDLSLVWQRSSEAYAGGLLDNLHTVRGSVRIVGGHNAGNILPGLGRIGRNLQIAGSTDFDWFMTNPSILVALHTVEGDVELERVRVQAAALPALGTVGGELRLREVDGPAPELGSAALRVSSLTVAGNQFSRLPLRPAPQAVVGTAPIRITDNPNLCDSAVEAFVASQAPAVRVGAVLTGNRPGC